MGLALLCAAVLAGAGCTRRYYRQDADQEVARFLEEKGDPVQWPLIDYWIYPHPYARFADLTGNPDFPPMPPDDPGAWALSPHPQKPKWIAELGGDGYLSLLQQFDAANRELRKLSPVEEGIPSAVASVISQSVEAKVPKPTPDEKALIAVGSPRWGRTKPYLINLEQCLDLATINSREFQSQRENLYLTALPVSLQRFAFLPQFLATQTAIRQWSTADSDLGKTNNGQINTTLGMSQLFPTGAMLLLRLANQTVIDFSSNHGPTLSRSTAMLDLTQPFLRGGGFAVTLEPLTQAERNLLYEMRDFSHFSRDFFVNIAGGTSISLSGTAAFAGLDLTISGTARNVGYYPTLQQLMAVQVERSNVQSLESLFKFFQAFAEGGGFSKLQVDQVEQQLNTARLTLLQAEINYRDNLDQFKLQLGLPTDLPVELDLAALEPITKQIRGYQKLESAFRGALDDLEKFETDPDAPNKIRAHIRDVVRTTPIARGTKFQGEFLERMTAWEALNSPATIATARMGQLAGLLLSGQGGAAAQAPVYFPRRTRLQEIRDELNRARDKLLAEQDEAEAKSLPFPPEKLKELSSLTVRMDQAELELAITGFEQRLYLTASTPARQAQARADLYNRILFRFALLLEEARTEKLNELEAAWPALPAASLGGRDLLSLPLDEAQNLAGQAALENRLDLMNQRAQVVDSWRKIAVAANSLLGTFDVRYNMNVLTPPVPISQPLNFKGSNESHQLIFNTELPLVRRLEQNNYRASLIAFQRQRRNLQATEDQILFQVRQSVRQLRQLEEQFRIQQRNLALALYQVDNALEVLRAPPAPGEQRDAATAAAALTQQLLQAQTTVPRAQNGLYQTWVSYLTTRMRLYRDLELMRIDSRGVWINDEPVDQPHDAVPGGPAPQPGVPPRPGASGP